MIKTIVVGLLRLFFLALPIAIIVFVVWLVRRARKWEQQKFGLVAAALSGEVVNNEKGQPLYVRANRDGSELRVWFDRERRDPHSDHSPRTDLVLDWRTSLGFTLFLCKDNVIFGLVEKLGGIADVVIGDPEFDKKYLIRAEEPARVTAFFENPNRRAAVNYLYQKGFREFQVTHEEVRIKRLYDPSRDLKPEVLQEYAFHLQKLAGG